MVVGDQSDSCVTKIRFTRQGYPKLRNAKYVYEIHATSSDCSTRDTQCQEILKEMVKSQVEGNELRLWESLCVCEWLSQRGRMDPHTSLSCRGSHMMPRKGKDIGVSRTCPRSAM